MAARWTMPARMRAMFRWRYGAKTFDFFEDGYERYCAWKAGAARPPDHAVYFGALVAVEERKHAGDDAGGAAAQADLDALPPVPGSIEIPALGITLHFGPESP